MFKFLSSKKVVLASTSPQRKNMLEQLGLQFDVFEAEVDERKISDGVHEPAEMVKMLAEAKAQHALDCYLKKNSSAPDLLVASDTVTALDGKIIGKPKDRNEAIETLKNFSGKSHSVFTGVCFYYRKTPDEELQPVSFVESSVVRFGNVPLDVIEDYVATGESYGKAGSYGTQGVGSVLIEGIDGDHFTIVGFPLHRFFMKTREAFM